MYRPYVNVIGGSYISYVYVYVLQYMYILYMYELLPVGAPTSTYIITASVPTDVLPVWILVGLATDVLWNSLCSCWRGFSAFGTAEAITVRAA